MAEWTYIPQDPPGRQYQYISQSNTLISKYEDGTESRREKDPGIVLAMADEYLFSDTDDAAAMAIFKAKRFATALSIVTYEPDEAPGTEKNFRFAAMTRVRRCADVNLWTVQWIQVP